MLKHEDTPQAPPQTPSRSAAEVRVTPEELAAAVTALQIRKEGQPGTIAIGDAVEELGLDVSPEEVLAEVEVGRRIAHKRLSWTAGKHKGLACLFLALLCFTGAGLFNATRPTLIDDSRLTPGTQPYTLEPRILALAPITPRPAVVTLAEAAEGKTLYCSVDAVEAVATSRNYQEAPQRQITQPVSEMDWPVVKHDKDLYVRGWVRLPLSKAAAKISIVEVFNKPNLSQLGVNPQQVTFRLDGMGGLGYQRLNPDGTGEFIFHTPRLNGHTYEKW